jgi:hypothetical protein
MKKNNKNDIDILYINKFYYLNQYNIIYFSNHILYKCYINYLFLLFLINFIENIIFLHFTFLFSFIYILK